MAFGFTRRSYVAVTVNLAAANTNYNLLDLINAIIAAETGAPNVQCPGMCRSLSLQAYPGIDGGGTPNTSDILIGDALLSTTRIGAILQVGGTFAQSSTIENANLGDIYVRTAGTNQKLLVNVAA